ncbi:MAG: small multi-drug export protein [Candidatus Faecousia sp.]|nr:small multi-drug export protein [Candidatus Faecousia sp.]
MDLVKHLLYILGISMVPVIELRGAIPVGLGMGLPFYAVFLTALIGNLLPVPFLILFTRRVFEWLRRKSDLLERFVSRLERKAASKEALLKKYELLGLCILVAIPLPGTGAWTGSLVAAVFDIRLKHAFPVIALGVLIAGVIVSLVSYGVSIFVM